MTRRSLAANAAQRGARQPRQLGSEMSAEDISVASLLLSGLR